MNELLEGVFVNFVGITSDSLTANHQHFLCYDGLCDKQWLQEHLVLPSFASCKLDLLGSGDVVERVLESVAAAALPWKRIAVATTDNGTTWSKGMRDGGIGSWPCATAHMLNRVIKNTMKSSRGHRLASTVGLLQATHCTRSCHLLTVLASICGSAVTWVSQLVPPPPLCSPTHPTPPLPPLWHHLFPYRRIIFSLPKKEKEKRKKEKN